MRTQAAYPWARCVQLTTVLVLLSACGGSGGDDASSGACRPTMGNPALCDGVGSTATATTGVATQIVFLSALPQNISMKGTGGPGRKESAAVEFRVLDKDGRGVTAAVVDFSLTTTAGGLTLSPASATTDAGGRVSTAVAAGIVNTPVRVLASVRGSSLSSVSDQLVISTGIPDQNSFTASPSIYNPECGDHDGTAFTEVTAFVADHFNNPVPDGTAVSFTTEAGAIDASCLTGLKETTLTDGSKIVQKGIPGQCKARFICQNPRPTRLDGSPWDGRSTVMAYALGEESFTDDPSISNGINRYDAGEITQDLREPFRYDRAIDNTQAHSVNVANASSSASAIQPALGEPFIDTDGNGVWNKTGDGFYNGVLQTAPNGKSPTVHVRQSFVLVFSGSTAVFSASAPGFKLDPCIDGIPFKPSSQTIIVWIRDGNPTVFPGNSLPGNILPAGTKIELTPSNGTLTSAAGYSVPNTNDPSQAAWGYAISVGSNATQTGPGSTTAGVTTPGYVCSNPVTSGQLNIKVTTPLGVVTNTSFPITD
jgi:hypothetical protein